MLRESYNLPRVGSSPAVHHILDDSACGRAAAALSAIYIDKHDPAPVFVFKIGTTRFAVADRSLTLHIFDASYTHLLYLWTVE